MISFTLVVFAALAASIANTSPIPISNSGPPATTVEASLLPVNTSSGSPVHSKLSEIHENCEDLGNKVMDETGFTHRDKNGMPAKRKNSLVNTARCKQDGSPHPPASGSAGLPQPQSKPVSASNSAVDFQQVMKDHRPNAVSASQSAAHYMQYRTSHGLDADDSDKIEMGKSAEYNYASKTSGDLGQHPHRHQTREGADCSIAAGGILCTVKGDAGRVQKFEASLVEPEIQTHIANID